MNPNTPETPRSPESLLEELNKIAPLSELTATELERRGWKEFFSYRETETNGAINKEHIELALKEIDKLMPPSTRETDWEIISAKYNDIPTKYPLEQDRLRALLRRKTPERIAWEKSQDQEYNS